MHSYIVTLAIACGACLDTGGRLNMRVVAPSRLDAAVTAERLADQALSDVEYTHARSVRQLPRHEPAAMALAA